MLVFPLAGGVVTYCGSRTPAFAPGCRTDDILGADRLAVVPHSPFAPGGNPLLDVWALPLLAGITIDDTGAGDHAHAPKSSVASA